MREPWRHTPVLVEEVLEYLAVRPGGRYGDGTAGEGGHVQAVLEASAPDGMVLGLDKDADALDAARERLAAYGGRVVLRNLPYTGMPAASAEAGMAPLDGVLLDLGLSSRQLEVSGRGFSFQRAEPLDMRFDATQDRTADDLVNRGAEAEIADVLWRYGEERRSRRIAAAVVRARPIRDTAHLAAVAAGAGERGGRVHPATRTFQALRIWVNRELETVAEGLEAAVRSLRPGGRLVVIAYHSLEDRVVKEFMARESRACVCPPWVLECRCGHAPALRRVTRAVVTPSDREVSLNPRARSARLRAAERLPRPAAGGDDP